MGSLGWAEKVVRFVHELGMESILKLKVTFKIYLVLN